MSTRRKMEWADIEAAYTYVGSSAAGIINDGREAFGVALIILMDAARPGVVDRCVPFPAKMLAEAFLSIKGKQMLGALVRSIMSPGPVRSALAKSGLTADFVVVAAEAWVVLGRDLGPDETPSRAPDRFEALNVVVNYADGSNGNLSIIKTVAGKRRVELAPLRPDIELTGRLTMFPDHVLRAPQGQPPK